MSRRKILISGGGIAGLTAALCLSQNGNRVELYERASTIQPQGAGIQISPNAFHVLAKLGLGKALRVLADQPKAIIMMDALKGSELNRLPLGMDIEDKYEAPYLVIHRADLQQVLLEACKRDNNIEVSFSSQVVDAVPHLNGVTVMIQTNNGTQERLGDILVVADGVHSTIRASSMELPKASYSGKTAWRALIPASEVSNPLALENTFAWLGPKAHAITYPVRQKAFLNVIAVTQETDPAKTTHAFPSQLAKKFSHWDGSFTDVFKTDVEWSGWPLFEMPAPELMSAKTFAFIGDAAHAMLPFAAQGAAQAIEDAHVLAQCLNETQASEKALSQFQKIRLPRVRKVVNTARSNGRIYHMSGILASSRNMALRILPGKKLLEKQDWIYRWKA